MTGMGTTLLSLFLLATAIPDCPPLQTVDFEQRNAYRGYIGILSYPSFFTHQPCASDTTIDVFAEPASDRRIAQLRRTKNEGCRPAVHVVANNSVAHCPRLEVPYGEYGYEERGFIALAEKGRWVQIVLDAGSGWIRKERGSEVHPYEHMAYGISQLTNGWNGVLFRAPGGKRWKPKGETDRSVEVLDSRTFRKMLWFKVRLLDESVCSGHPKTIAVGWVPAYDANWDPLVFNYSRGC